MHFLKMKKTTTILVKQVNIINIEGNNVKIVNNIKSLIFDT